MCACAVFELGFNFLYLMINPDLSWEGLFRIFCMDVVYLNSSVAKLEIWDGFM